MKTITSSKLQSIIFYLILLFLPTQLGKHFWPDFSYIFGLRVDYLSPTVYVTDVLLLVLFALWFMSLRKKIIKAKKIIQYWQLFFFLTILLAGVILSHNMFAGLYGIAKFLEYVCFGFYIATHKTNLKNIRAIFSFGMLFESLLAIVQYYNQSSVGGIFYFLGERLFNGQTPGIANASLQGMLVLRPYGTFSHPNVLAAYMLISMVFLIFGKFAKNISFIKKIFFTLPFFVGTIALFLTLSRLAIFMWIVICIWHFCNKKISFSQLLPKKTPFIFSIVTISLFMATAQFLPNLYDRFFNTRLADESIWQREELIVSSIRLFIKHPVLGVGLQNFYLSFSLLPKNSEIVNMQPVHNIFLLVLSETGIAGFVFFIWFIVKTYKKINQQILQYKKRNFVLLFSVLILGLFDHYFFTLQQGQLLFSFILGLCWSVHQKVDV